MKNNTYLNLIQQSRPFPQGGFSLEDSELSFYGISIKSLIKKYGTPFKLLYLPKIGSQIETARKYFNQAIQEIDYSGSYHYAYCTKCNHFYPILKQALKHQVNLETSSPIDIDLIISLFEKGDIDKNRTILHNGYKTARYLKQIIKLQNLGFRNTIVILDSKKELQQLLKFNPKATVNIGIRMAITQEAKSPFHTSRLGIPPAEIMSFFRKEIKNNKAVKLKMFHFFMDTGIKDNAYYWGQLQKAIDLYIELKKENHDLDSFNIGGGFPIPNHLNFNYNYQLIIKKILSKIKNTCQAESIPEPDIHSEFGKYTVGESSAVIFEVLETKRQNDSETWHIIDNSLLNTIPDAWALKEKFILLPINKWQNNYERVNIGGISCDHTDYYNSEDMNQEVLLPKFTNKEAEPLYLGFFHTGAYQDAVSGYGGAKHCLIPTPQHILVDLDENGNLIDWVFRSETSTEKTLSLLGY